MARPPRPENANNPLRQLRALLKDPAKEAPTSQQDLALLCQIPVDTIKSIEVGRLALNTTVLRKIAEAIGASWDYEQEKWTRGD
jgi:ribosome-binding protein aMBF1 (putative translation factor)